MTDERHEEELDARVRILTGLAEQVRPSALSAPAPLFDAEVGDTDSLSTLIDALATDLGLPRAALIRRLLDDMRRQVARDHAVLGLLQSLNEAERFREETIDRDDRGRSTVDGQG